MAPPRWNVRCKRFLLQTRHGTFGDRETEVVDLYSVVCYVRTRPVMRTRAIKLSWLLAALVTLGASGLAAQSKGLDFTYGTRWRPDPNARVYSASLFRPLFSSVSYGIGVTHLNPPRSDPDRTGGELSVAVGRDGSGLYVVASGALAFRHDDGSAVAQWSTGAGYALRLLSVFSLGVEARYLVEDTGLHGFWRLDPSERGGLLLQGRFALAIGGRRPRAGPTPGGPTFDPPSESEMENLARLGGASREGAALAAKVVQTAIDVMGTPYKWGGEDSNGYDCSGLIQYAYGQHGIILPRVSRDQVRMGRRIAPNLQHVRPGDVLGFSVEGDRVTHVGLYVGEGRFIHSASGGVKISSLAAAEPEGRWWRSRWTAAQRILN